MRENRSIRWEDTVSAFSGRIRSGIIINIKHKDPKQFLNDAFFLLFKSRIAVIPQSKYTLGNTPSPLSLFISHY